MDGWVQVVADLLCKEGRGVLEVFELTLRGGVTLLGFDGQRGILRPRAVCRHLCIGEQFRCVGGAKHGVAQAHFLDADLLEHGDGAFALIIQFGKADNKRLKRGGGVGVKERLELFGGHARNLAEVGKRVAARRGGNLHLNQCFGERRAAHLRLDTHGR